MRCQLNLATRPFPRYRATNVLLLAVLPLILSFSVWQMVGFFDYTAQSAELAGVEQEIRVAWEFLGGRVNSLERQLGRPAALTTMQELAFLNQIIGRKSFSWSRLLNVVEEVIPRGVYLTALQPQIDDIGGIRVEMEARGRTVEDISEFISSLERTQVFQDVVISVEERDSESDFAEITVSMDTAYRPEEIPQPAEAP